MCLVSFRDLIMISVHVHPWCCNILYVLHHCDAVSILNFHCKQFMFVSFSFVMSHEFLHVLPINILLENNKEVGGLCFLLLKNLNYHRCAFNFYTHKLIAEIQGLFYFNAEWQLVLQYEKTNVKYMRAMLTNKRNGGVWRSTKRRQNPILCQKMIHGPRPNELNKAYWEDIVKNQSVISYSLFDCEVCFLLRLPLNMVE